MNQCRNRKPKEMKRPKEDDYFPMGDIVGRYEEDCEKYMDWLEDLLEEGITRWASVKFQNKVKQTLKNRP